jgi:hypothetical protein
MKTLRKSLKIATLVTVALLALGAAAYVYACSQNGATANANEQWMGMQNMRAFFWPKNITLPNNVTMPWGRMVRMPQMRVNGLPVTERLLQNGTLSSVNGTVVSEVRGMLVLDASTGQIRVLLPKDWTVGNEVVDRAKLFNSTFASAGQGVTVKVLETDVFSNANFSVNVMMGYEVINATGTHAYAVLPFNIQPKS